MSTWFINVAIAMDSEVELSAVQDYALVQAGKQDMLGTSESIHRNRKKSVVASRVAAHNGCVAIRPCFVRSDNLPLQRVFEIDQFGFVESQESHVNIL